MSKDETGVSIGDRGQSSYTSYLRAHTPISYLSAPDVLLLSRCVLVSEDSTEEKTCMYMSIGDERLKGKPEGSTLLPCTTLGWKL